MNVAFFSHTKGAQRGPTETPKVYHVDLLQLSPRRWRRSFVYMCPPVPTSVLDLSTSRYASATGMFSPAHVPTREQTSLRHPCLLAPITASGVC